MTVVVLLEWHSCLHIALLLNIDEGYYIKIIIIIIKKKVPIIIIESASTFIYHVRYNGIIFILFSDVGTNTISTCYFLTRLRNLSSDTHCRSQSPSAPTSRFKLAEHRYTREDMLTLFSPDPEAPPELKATPKIFIEKALEPLGFTNPTETEQVLFIILSTAASRSPMPFMLLS